jgi:hypothetical protein
LVITFSLNVNPVPELIPDLIAKMKEGYDMLIASPCLGDAISEDDGVVIGFENWLFTRTVNLTACWPLHRCDGNISRLQKADSLSVGAYCEDVIALPEKLFGTKISWEPLLSARAAKAKLKVGEISGDEPPHIGSERKLRILRRGAAYFFQFIRELWFWKPAK